MYVAICVFFFSLSSSAAQVTQLGTGQKFLELAEKRGALDKKLEKSRVRTAARDAEYMPGQKRK